MRIIAAGLIFCSASTFANSWQLNEQKDQMTDEVTHSIRAFSEGDKLSSLSVGCNKDGYFEQLTLLGRQISGSYIDVRVGDFKATKKWTVVNAAGGSGAFSPDSLRLRERMLSAKEMKIRFETSLESVTLDFDLAGYRDGYEQLKQKCK